jgi:hypothetical protein
MSEKQNNPLKRAVARNQILGLVAGGCILCGMGCLWFFETVRFGNWSVPILACLFGVGALLIVLAHFLTNDKMRCLVCLGPFFWGRDSPSGGLRPWIFRTVCPHCGASAGEMPNDQARLMQYSSSGEAGDSEHLKKSDVLGNANSNRARSTRSVADVFAFCPACNVKTTVVKYNPGTSIFFKAEYKCARCQFKFSQEQLSTAYRQYHRDSYDGLGTKIARTILGLVLALIVFQIFRTFLSSF